MTTVNSFADRLKSKSVKNSIINNIARDFNLTPILAEAYFNQIKDGSKDVSLVGTILDSPKHKKMLHLI